MVCIEVVKSLYTVNAVAYGLVFGIGLLLLVASTKKDGWILVFGLVLAPYGGYRLIPAMQGLAAPILTPEYAECVNAPKE